VLPAVPAGLHRQQLLEHVPVLLPGPLVAIPLPAVPRRRLVTALQLVSTGKKEYYRLLFSKLFV
jgi:hypothetical protein